MSGDAPESDELQPQPTQSAGAETRKTEETVPLDRIARGPKAPEELANASVDAKAQKEKDFLAAESERFTKELGWLGRTFGGRREKPGNISALVICMIFAFIFVAFIAEVVANIWFPFTGHSSVPFDRIFTGLTSIVTLILGYLFGSNERSEK